MEDDICSICDKVQEDLSYYSDGNQICENCISKSNRIIQEILDEQYQPSQKEIDDMDKASMIEESSYEDFWKC